MVLLVAVVFLGTQSTQALSANTGDTLFFSRFGVEFLPQMYVVLGLLTMLALLGYSGALGAIARTWFYPGLLIGGGAVMLALRLAVSLDERWVYAALWLSVNVLILVTFTLMWNVAGDVADARSAKRLYPLFAAAGVLGGFIGNLATGPLARTIGAENILVVLALIFGLTAAVAARVSRAYISVRPSGRGPVRELRRGAYQAFRAPLLRLLGGAMLFAAVMFYLVVFPFSTAVAESFDSEAAIASYLGLFSAAATAVTFAVSLFIANRMFARFGVLLAMFVVAVIYVTGFGLWLASFTLITASMFRFVQWVGVNGVGGTARTAVFNVLRADKRGEVMAFLSAVPLQLGVIAAGALLWVGQRLLTPTQTFGVGLGFAFGYAVVVWTMRHHYAEALVTALRSGVAHVFTEPQTGHPKPAADADVLSAVISGLEDERPAMRRISAELLGRLGGADAIQPLTDLLDDPEVEVRIAALEGLSRLPVEESGVVGLTDILDAIATDENSGEGLEDSPSEVQGRAAVLLYRVGDAEMAAEVVTDLLRSPDARTRRVALQAIAELGWSPDLGELRAVARSDPSPSVRAEAAEAMAEVVGPGDELVAAMQDESPVVRAAAGAAWRDHGGGPDAPFQLLRQGPPSSWEAAVIALEESSDDMKGEVLSWSAPKVADLAELSVQRAALEAASDGLNMPAVSYLAYLIAEREWESDRLAIRALGLFEAHESVELIVRGIRSQDADAHAQALEAVESIGGALGRAVVPILEEKGAEVRDVRSVLEALSHDPNPWVRALAVRSVRELIAEQWKTAVESAASDEDPIVRSQTVSALAMMESDMTETLDTLGTLDRMLYLRQVPIFSSLHPEDLERLANVMTEQLFDPGDVIFGAGEPGEEMLVIVEGRILVSAPGDQSEVDTREFGVGDYVGELALLRDAPRSADVTALETVRVLALDSASLNNVLVDRPDVARAMLEVLAERLADPLRFD